MQLSSIFIVQEIAGTTEGRGDCWTSAVLIRSQDRITQLAHHSTAIYWNALSMRLTIVFHYGMLLRYLLLLWVRCNRVICPETNLCNESLDSESSFSQLQGAEASHLSLEFARRRERGDSGIQARNRATLNVPPYHIKSYFPTTPWRTPNCINN